MSLRLIAYFLAAIFLSNIAIAAEQTYVREYTYQASEADSKLSARAIALQEVKRELLSELGTHVTALVKIQNASDGTHLGTEEIETLSAGVTRVEILDEEWNGVVYVLKAQIKADPEDVLKSLHKMLDADKKQRKISQLDGELSRIRTENIQIAESLTQSKKEVTVALAEIARLKKQLEEKQTDATRQILQTAYQQQVDQLSLNEWFESAMQYYDKGNYEEASHLYRKAAEQGHTSAQFNLGLMYIKGDGVIRDTRQALYWWQKAAEQGRADAQFNLGVAYESGDGIPRDAKQAVYWYQKAAEQGLDQAQFNLGVMYDSGEGVTRDAKQAVHWYEKSAEQGNTDAQFNLGMTFLKGEGVTRNAKQAVYWWQKAAEQGLAQAQFNLGFMYEKGIGVIRDAKQAVLWYRKAAAQGNINAQAALRGNVAK
ncbi:MAG TPA: tetratricopeptide repeat protein [Sideroxyarcus sp.]|nr:tetratricopeptide repeat protein [Sideroxyarcus sp.]